MNGHSPLKADWIYRKVLRHPLLAAFLRDQVSSDGPIHVGWGYRPSGISALHAARRTGGRLLLLEDAFVRSIQPGIHGPVYGLIADSKGMHYLAEGESDLLESVEAGGISAGWMRGDLRKNEDPGVVMSRFREIGASKYNWFPREYLDEALPDEQGILVVDQSRGDASIRHGGMVVGDFDRMLGEALDRVDGGKVYVRAHPDHVFRKKHSCFSPPLLSDRRIQLLPPDLSPAQCFSFCHTVMVGSSLLGMEALIHGKKVVTYGNPFFAGRGLTEDFSPAMASIRKRPVTLLELFESAYLRYCHYFDPDTGEPCGLGEILDHLALQKEMFRKNRGHQVTIGFSSWKQSVVPSYLRSPAGKLTQVKKVSEADAALKSPDARILVWGRKAEIPASLKGRAVRVEDGFIRSKGLGAAFNFPYSWVFDEAGIYFDPTAPSDLENLYNHGFTELDLTHASQLIDELREKRLTKYNLTGIHVALDPELTRGRKILLVPGQVENDASILFGSPIVKSNLELLHRVRTAEPDAFIVFKAHPDLVAGARHGRVLSSALADACDLAVTDGNILDWLERCDEVHTMTSTVGFEALVRKKPVITYGMPFYAGWGLTTDRLVCERRQRKLTLEELVCGALVKYPRYMNPATGEFTTAIKVARLLAGSGSAEGRRAWYLRGVSILKRGWVRCIRYTRP